MTCRGIYLENVNDIPEVELLLFYLGYNLTISSASLKQHLPCYLFLYSPSINGCYEENNERKVTRCPIKQKRSVRTEELIQYLTLEEFRTLSKENV